MRIVTLYYGNMRENKMIVYRIYKQMNAADTWRDPDDIHIEELGYKQSLNDALEFVQDYITKNFFRKDTKIHKRKDGTYYAIDMCSYGWIIEIKPIEID